MRDVISPRASGPTMASMDRTLKDLNVAFEADRRAHAYVQWVMARATNRDTSSVLAMLERRGVAQQHLAVFHKAALAPTATPGRRTC
jgi:hypothetical protein